MPQLLSGIAGQEDDPVNCNELEKEEQIGYEKILRFAVHGGSYIFDGSMWNYTGTDAC